jgi:hypothetical protein
VDKPPWEWRATAKERKAASGPISTRRIPAPQAQAFVACRKITNDPQTGEIVIIGPVSHVPITGFPAVIRLVIYAHATGGHGTYQLAFELRAANGDTVWRWQPVDPLHHADPLVPMQITFDELRVSVQQPGRYDLVLLAGDGEIATQPLLIGPAEAFRGDGHTRGTQIATTLCQHRARRLRWASALPKAAGKPPASVDAPRLASLGFQGHTAKVDSLADRLFEAVSPSVEPVRRDTQRGTQGQKPAFGG